MSIQYILYLLNLIVDVSGGAVDVWIGITDRKNHGIFKKLDDGILKFQFWSTYEPNSEAGYDSVIVSYSLIFLLLHYRKCLYIYN